MKKNLPFIILIAAIAFLGFTGIAHAEMKYELLEPFPGFFRDKATPTLPEMILAIYQFGIWTVGIAGLFMLTVGGVWYMTSAGNNATAETAKKIITDSLLGIVAALSAYLIVYVINPDLTKVDIKFTKVELKAESTELGGGPGGAAGGEECEVMQNGPCTIENLQSAFGSDAEKMSKICNRESSGNIKIESKTDLCTDGKSFSIGLFQINMITSAGTVGCKGSEIFETDPKIWEKEGCAVRSADNSYCARRKCRVINDEKYNACIAKLIDGNTNIQAAKSLYSSKGGLDHWQTSAGRCQVN